MTPDTSGPTLPEPSAYYDPDSSSWRMSGGMFPSDSMPSLATFPASGMTRAGALYELPMPVPPTDEPASSSLPTPTARDHRGHNQRRDSTCLTGALLPTPAANDHTGAETREAREAREAGGPALRDLPTLLPTPRATDGEKGQRTPEGAARELARGRNVDLGMVGALLPTPAVNDMGAGKTPEDWDAWAARMQEKHGNGNGHGASLAIEALRLLPTPPAGDGKASGSRNLPGSAAHPGVSLTDALLHGGSTTPRSADGKPSSDDPHPTPPSPDATDDPDCLPLSWSGCKD